MDERPLELVEYRSLVIEKNKLEAKIKKLRPRVGELLEETGGYDDLYLQKIVKWDYLEDVIYDWVVKNYPQFTKEICKKTADLDKFGELIKRGDISEEDIPLSCMVEKVEWHVKTTPKKKEELNEDTSPE